MTHTPLPWRVYHEVFRPQLSDMKVIEVQDSGGESIVFWTGFDSADQPEKVKLANARFIVKACNCHYDLLEALEALYAHTRNDCTICGLNEQAKAAINKAHGGHHE